MIPNAFDVQVKTPEPVVITIDVSEKTMVLGAFVMIIGAVTWMKIKKS